MANDKEQQAYRVKQLRLKYGDHHPEVQHYAAKHGLPPIEELVFGEPGYGTEVIPQEEVGVPTHPPASLGLPVFKALPESAAKPEAEQKPEGDKKPAGQPAKTVDTTGTNAVQDTA